jgi:hypothetical protein
MNTMRLWIAAALVMLSSGVWMPRTEASELTNGDVIVEWNQLLQGNVGGPPFAQARSYAILHVAMADAVVAIEERYKPYHSEVWAPSGASAEAAAAQAVHDVLVSLLPATQATADTTLENRLAHIPPGRVP